MNKALFNAVFNRLTTRRREVLLKFLANQTDAAIAKSLNITEATVRKHIEEICKAFGLTNEFLDERRSKRIDLIALFAKYKPELLGEGSLKFQERSHFEEPPQPQDPTKTEPDTQTWKYEYTLDVRSGGFNSVAISAEGLIAGGDEDGTIKLWLPNSMILHWTLEKHSGNVCSVAISPDEKLLVSSDNKGTINIWDLPTRELLYSISLDSGLNSSIVISPDAQNIVAGIWIGRINIWNLYTGQLLRFLTTGNSIYSIALSPNGQNVAIGSYCKVELWNLNTGKFLVSLEGHSDAVSSVAISSNGRRLASGSWDNTIKLWDLETGKLLFTLNDHSDSVYSIAISPDGQILASGSGDNNVKIWHLETGSLISTLEGHSGAVKSVAFNSDGQLLASSSNIDRTIKIWKRD